MIASCLPLFMMSIEEEKRYRGYNNYSIENNNFELKSISIGMVILAIMSIGGFIVCCL